MSEKTVLKLLQDLDENKAAGLDNVPGKSLKDGATVLDKLISQTCNLSKKYSIFPPDCFKKFQKQPPKIIVLYPYFL